MRKSSIIRNPVSLPVPDGSQAGGTLRLFNRLLFFFPVLVKNNCADYQSEDNHSEKSETDFIHKFYSPLSRKIPSTIKRITILQPVIYDPIGTLFGEAILPTTITAKTIWLKLNRTFAKFSLCFFVNLIFKNILSKAKISVKQIACISLLEKGSREFPPFLLKGGGGIFRERLSD